MSKERQYLTAVSVINGIIILIEPNGSIGTYRQRGIQRLSKTLQEVPNILQKLDCDEFKEYRHIDPLSSLYQKLNSLSFCS